MKALLLGGMLIAAAAAVPAERPDERPAEQPVEQPPAQQPRHARDPMADIGRRFNLVVRDVNRVGHAVDQQFKHPKAHPPRQGRRVQR